MTRRLRQLRRLAAVLSTTLAAGCLPYTVGSTAQTVPVGEVVRTSNAAFVLGGSAPFDDSTGTGGASSNFPSSDVEVRFGLTDHSDFGLRIPSGSGLVVNYKRRHSGAANPDSAGFASMWGAGIVNYAQHSLVEGTLIWSGNRTGQTVRYGGLRVMQTFPLDEVAVKDTPSLGAFFGFRWGTSDRGVTPELAIYYDKSALDIRKRNVIFVPSVTLTGMGFLGRIFR